jgi:hypothetical protein
MLRRWWKRLLQRPGVKRRTALLKLGPRSRLVLAKLGFDMRASYDDLLKDPLPDSHTSLVKQLPGQHDVIDLGTDRESPTVSGNKPER